MVAMLPNGGTGKVYYTRGLSKLNRAADIQTGMVGRLEKNSAATKLKNWFKFETSAEGVVLDINGNTIAHTLLYQNSYRCYAPIPHAHRQSKYGYRRLQYYKLWS